MANPFEIMVSNLNQMGFFGFLLPWIFIFAISFGILTKTKVLGEDMRVNAVISIVLGFFVVGFGGTFLADFFINIFGIAAMIIAGILVLVLFMGMAGISIEKIGDNKAVLVFFIGLAIVLFFVALGAVYVRFSNDAAAIVLIIIILAASVAFITGAGGKKD